VGYNRGWEGYEPTLAAGRIQTYISGGWDTNLLQQRADGCKPRAGGYEPALAENGGGGWTGYEPTKGPVGVVPKKMVKLRCRGYGK